MTAATKKQILLSRKSIQANIFDLKNEMVSYQKINKTYKRNRIQNRLITASKAKHSNSYKTLSKHILSFK